MRVSKRQLRRLIREAIIREAEFAGETQAGQLTDTEVEDANFRNQLQAEKDMKAAGLAKDEIALMWPFIKDQADAAEFMDTPMYEKLFGWFAFDGPVRMPYGTAKARDGMPDDWILDYLQDPSAFNQEAEVWAAK
jgi:hypothetical protein